MSPAQGLPPIKDGTCHNNFNILALNLTFAQIERK